MNTLYTTHSKAKFDFMFVRQFRVVQNIQPIDKSNNQSINEPINKCIDLSINQTYLLSLERLLI